jgi:hypothetical protein
MRVCRLGPVLAARSQAHAGRVRVMSQSYHRSPH